MIIHALKARNVLKYARLELSNLPENALIAISGSNESGKTTVVETICFALFGRTFSLTEDQIVKSIRWGETSNEVELVFSTRDSERYTVRRSLGSDGVQGARLLKENQHEAVASGATQVRDAIVRISGFNFDQYLDSLYLAQREISAPQSQSDTIKAVAGGVNLEMVADDFSLDIMEQKKSVRETEQSIAKVQEQIAALGIEDGAIVALEDRLSALDNDIHSNEDTISQLRQASDDLSLGTQRITDIGREICSASTGMSLNHWKDFSQRLSTSMQAIEDTCDKLETDNPLCEGEELKSFAWSFEGRLSAYQPVKQRCSELRDELAIELGESDASGVAAVLEHSLPHQQQQVATEMHRARRWHGISKINLFFVFLFTLCAWGSWYLLVKDPANTYTANLVEFLRTYVPLWQASYRDWLLPVAGGLSGLLLLLLFRSVGHGRRVRSATERHSELGRRIGIARHRAELLDFMDTMAFNHALESLEELDDQALTSRVVEFIEGPGRALLADDELKAMQERLHDLLKDMEVQVHVVREDIAAAVGALDNESERCRREIAVSGEAILREQEKIQRATVLNDEIVSLQNIIPIYDEKIRLLSMARGLIRQTCQELYSRFNRVLREYTGMVMPKLTDNRYQHLQIDDDLTVRVFSSDKNDFADLGEVSSGTQRQIMLAVRLAMAKALTEASVQGKQFVILDEPFAFFDQERVRSTLQALPSIDPQMSQLWIIAQEFEAEGPYTVRLDCTRDAGEMVFSGG